MGTQINEQVIDRMYRIYILSNDVFNTEKLLKTAKSLINKEKTKLSKVAQEQLVELCNYFISKLKNENLTNKLKQICQE